MPLEHNRGWGGWKDAKRGGGRFSLIYLRGSGRKRPDCARNFGRSNLRQRLSTFYLVFCPIAVEGLVELCVKGGENFKVQNFQNFKVTDL